MNAYNLEDSVQRSNVAAGPERQRRGGINSPQTEQISVTLPVAVVNSLRAECKNRGISLSRLCRERLEKALRLPEESYSSKPYPRHFTHEAQADVS